MQNKTLLGGIIGFILGGLLVSVVATTIEKQSTQEPRHGNSGMPMHDMTDELQNKTGDDFDRAFLDMMIEHHEGAVDMAKMAAERAKHAEIKDLSKKIEDAQKAEINQMKQWQQSWGYTTNRDSHIHDGDPMPHEH